MEYIWFSKRLGTPVAKMIISAALAKTNLRNQIHIQEMNTMKQYKAVITGVAIIAVLGMVGFAFAHDEYGYGRHHKGYGKHMGMEYGDSNRYASLNDEQIEALDASREAFLNDTKDLRANIYQKRLEIRSELAKQDPDTAKLKAVQKELSELEATFDQKRLEHQIEMNKIAPDARRAYGRGYGGRMMGDGSGYRGQGHCWE
jgi:zinc resistance-associated protein